MVDVLISVIALFNYDSSIFDNFRADLPGIDRQTAIDKIMIDNGELTVLYNEPETFKFMLQNWCRVSEKTWAKMWDALNAEYNPIHNYDRTEDWTDAGKDTGTNQASATRQVAGWNQESTGWADSERNTGEGSDTRTTENTRKGRAYGNIGVTTSQQMIESEIDLRLRNNMYQFISDSFRENFCVMVY